MTDCLELRKEGGRVGSDIAYPYLKGVKNINKLLLSQVWFDRNNLV